MRDVSRRSVLIGRHTQKDKRQQLVSGLILKQFGVRDEQMLGRLIEAGLLV